MNDVETQRRLLEQYSRSRPFSFKRFSVRWDLDMFHCNEISLFVALEVNSTFTPQQGLLMPWDRKNETRQRERNNQMRGYTAILYVSFYYTIKRLTISRILNIYDRNHQCHKSWLLEDGGSVEVTTECPPPARIFRHNNTTGEIRATTKPSPPLNLSHHRQDNPAIF